MSLFILTPDLDQGPIAGKAPMSLAGHMTDIFKEMTRTGIDLISAAIEGSENLRDLPVVAPRPGGEPRTVRRRIRPEDSGVELSKLSDLTTREIYNLARCREHPYPNFFVEDATGKVFLESVRYEPKKSPP